MVAPSFAADSVAFALAPEGVKIAMSLPDATALLSSAGYQRSRGCTFERKDADGGSTQLILRVATEDALRRSPQKELALPFEQKMGEERLANECLSTDLIVTSVTYKRLAGGHAQPVDPLGEIKAFAATLGDKYSCAILQAFDARCEWRKPGGDRMISALNVRISNAGHREYKIEGDSLEFLTPLPERASNMEAIRQQAASVCETYELGMRTSADTIRTLSDCGCIAERVSKAYGIGELDTVDVHSVDKYNRGCPAPRERLVPYFAKKCTDAMAFGAPEWANGGGCTCVGEKAADAFLAAPDVSSHGLDTKHLTECGYK
jgi:hypothetical protein